MRSQFKMGWIIVCFDLPVMTKVERRKATRFRKDLLDLGYYMLQYSIYIRNCVTYEKVDSYIKNLKKLSPGNGSVVAFYITDNQWKKSVNIQYTDYVKSERAILAGKDMPKQMTFW